jgi:DUF1009 family protein
MSEPVGLIAGAGRFPIEIARAARLSGLRVVTVAIRDLADPELGSEAEGCQWLYLGELEALLQRFRDSGVRRCVMAGKVPKTFLYERARELRPDERALGLLRDLGDRSDDSILLALASVLESEGFVLERQASFTPELLAPEGALGSLAPSPEHWQEIRFGWPIARALGRLDVGQSVVVRKRAVMALEAIEGTDEAIRRGGALGGPGACVVKVAKPSQDLRFDMPTIGVTTLETLVEVKAAVLAVEAGATLVLGQREVVEAADAAGIPVVGVPSSGPTAEPA